MVVGPGRRRGERVDHAKMDMVAEGVRQKIREILESKPKTAGVAFVIARSVVPDHIPPTYKRYIDSYLARNPIDGWVFYGLSYHSKKGNKGKHYIYVRRGFEDAVMHVVKAWCNRPAEKLIKYVEGQEEDKKKKKKKKKKHRVALAVWAR